MAVGRNTYASATPLVITLMFFFISTFVGEFSLRRRVLLQNLAAVESCRRSFV
jgi:hypothetical protein